jgi:hypothetical protein
MRLPIATVVVAVLATMVSATHMRVEEIALRSGFFKTIGNFLGNLFGGAKAVDPPPAKIDTPPAAPPVAKFDAPPVAPGQTSILSMKSPALSILYAHPETLQKEFMKLSKADKDIFNTRAIKYGHPPVILPPKNYPAPSSFEPFRTILNLSDKQIKTMYRESPSFFLDQFKKLPPANQAIFNAKIKKFKLGDPLIPIPPGVTKPIYKMTTTELKTLYRNARVFFDQEAMALPPQVWKKLYAQVSSMHKNPVPDAIYIP